MEVTRPPAAHRLSRNRRCERRWPSPPQEADRRCRPVRRSVPAHRTAAARLGFEFLDEVKGGTIPGQFMPAVEKGVRQVLGSGAVAGYPMQDVRVIVYDGKHHPVDSKEVAFVAAGKKAFLDAIAKARPQVLEPIVDLEVAAPESHIADIGGGLSTSSARASTAPIRYVAAKSWSKRRCRCRNSKAMRRS